MTGASSVGLTGGLFDPPPALFALRAPVRLRLDKTPGIVAAIRHHCGGTRYALRLRGLRQLTDFLHESAIEAAGEQA